MFDKKPQNKISFTALIRWAIIVEVGCWLLTTIVYFILSSNPSFQFLTPKMGYLLLLIPIILSVFAYRWKWKHELYSTYKGQTRMLWITFRPRRYFLSYFFFRMAIFFIIVALCQPVMGNRKVKGSKKILDLVICLDISNSMNTQDMGEKTSRLTVAKRAITQLVNNLKGERIAVVIFANDAYTQLPLTQDYGAAKLFLQEIESNMISDQGTNIGSALEVAQSQFVDEASGHAILVITDGEDHEKLWKEQVQKIAESKIELVYYGIGTTRGGLIPIDPTNPNPKYKRQRGQVIVSRLNEAEIAKMATRTDSKFSIAKTAFPNMTTVISELENVKTQKVSELEFTVQRSYFQIPLLIAVAAFLAYLFVPILENRMERVLEDKENKI